MEQAIFNAVAKAASASADQRLALVPLACRIIGYGIYSRREGLLALSEMLEKEQDPYLRQGLEIALDGCDSEFQDECLSLHAAQAFSDPGDLLHALLIRYGVLAIGKGHSPAAIHTQLGILLGEAILGPLDESASLRGFPDFTNYYNKYGNLEDEVPSALPGSAILGSPDPSFNQVSDAFHAPDKEALARFVDSIGPTPEQTLEQILVGAIEAGRVEEFRRFVAELGEDATRTLVLKASPGLRLALISALMASQAEIDMDEAQKALDAAGLNSVLPTADTQAVSKLKHIVKGMDEEELRYLLAQIEELPSAYAQLRSLVFLIEDIALLHFRDIQKLLRELNTRQLTIVLASSSESLKRAVFANMSARSAALMQEDLNFMGPVSPQHLRFATAALRRVIFDLADAGEIVLMSPGRERRQAAESQAGETGAAGNGNEKDADAP